MLLTGRLESMAVVQSSVSYKLSSFPYLTHLNINSCHGATKTRFCRVKISHDVISILEELRE